MPAKHATQQSFDKTTCEHLRLEPVINYGGGVLAWRCCGCTTIMSHVGVCDGCGETGRKLGCLVPSRRMRFCDVLCYKRWSGRRRAAAAAETRALKIDKKQKGAGQ